MLAAVFFWAGRERQPVGHHRVKHRPLITICLTAIADLSLKKPTCETQSRRSLLQHDIVVSRLTSMSIRTIGHEGVSHVDRWSFLTLRHISSYTSNLSSSIVRTRTVSER